ncbi:MAG TPA: TetR/AcrR family transcriptional regulator [Solirubrobacteraceae bacterium]|jgi:AcrR family transcriptional regulator|nr:TetR/AcrR family transcriptional regulator [Solirubrobacteraceae bacterium]
MAAEPDRSQTPSSQEADADAPARPMLTAVPNPQPPEPQRSRRPSGPVAREQARARQRLRLAAAMIECVAEDGYRATRVADVIARAGVSRKTFYEHFDNKEDCLLATFDLISEEAMRRVESAYREAQGWPGRVEAAIRALFEAAIENPGALRLSLLEIAAVGPAGIARRERSIERYESFIRDALELAPGEGEVSDVMLKAVAGGLNRVLYRRVLRADAEELRALVPDLAAWATSYYPTPAPLLAEPVPLSRARRTAIALQAGRAPGTLAPHPLLGGRRGLARGDQNVSRSFVVQNQRARILDAVTNLTASGGYASLKVEEIAEQAAVSLVAFYEHFADKEDAFLVAYEVGHGKGLAAVERAYAAESDWRLAVRAGIEALFGFLASEPSFAHIGLVDALIATPHSADRSNDGVSAFARMLAPGTERMRGIMPGAVTVEAIAGGLFDLCLHYGLTGRIRELPELVPSATYIALAPFLGGQEAARIAMAHTSPRRVPARG